MYRAAMTAGPTIVLPPKLFKCMPEDSMQKWRMRE